MTAPLRLANENIEILLDAHSGRVMAVRNRVAGLDLIAGSLDSPPWRIELDGRREWLEHFTDFQHGWDGEALMLRWQAEEGLIVTSRVWLPAGGDSIRMTVAVENAGGAAVDKIEYPVLAGIGPLVPRGEIATLAHSQGTGFLFHDPLRTFLPEEGPRGGLRYSPYPEGFNGSTMQFMAYQAEPGGFYFATRDSGKAMKWFNFYKDPATAALWATIMHQAGHVSPGLDFAPGYEIEIACLYGGEWYEAAERYKQWAVTQPWTQQGTARERSDRPRWLLDEVGLATFGVNAAHDRAAWLDAFHQMAGRPVLHILGPNWARTGQDYQNHLPGGRLEDWLPANFSAANIETIRRNGDYWVPFEFDLLCSHDGGSGAPVLENRQVLPAKKYSFDRYVFPFMCPATPFWRTFHAERDAALVQESGADGIYYDISANNVLMACRAEGHDHHPGGGQEIADAYAAMFDETKAAMQAVAGKPVSVGTEMITELLIPQVDFYQARAEANPLGPFEADFFRAWILAGKAEKIPLFAYVYHEYGPVRMDGWAKLSRETGDAFYWVASRVLLWGGLFELNYEFSGLEALDGRLDDPAEHYYPFAPIDYPIDPHKAAFAGEVAEARAGWGRDYLAYGTMLRPPKIDAAPVELDYYLYNAGKDFHSYQDRGTITVPAVLASAWRYGSERAAVFFANVTAERQHVTFEIDPAALGLRDIAGLLAGRVDRFGRQVIGVVDGAKQVTIELAPRQIAAVELVPQAGKPEDEL